MTDTTLVASADTYLVDGSYSNDNRNSDGYLGLDNYIYNYRILVKWDLSTIPPGSTVSSAQVRLWLYDEIATNDGIAHCYRLKRNWVETQATWSAYSTGNNWQTAGATGANDIDTTSLANLFLDEHTAENVGKVWTLPNSVVEGWINGTYDNYGLMFRVYNQGSSACRWLFRDRVYVTEGHRPSLLLTYEAGSLGRSQAIIIG